MDESHPHPHAMYPHIRNRDPLRRQAHAASRKPQATISQAERRAYSYFVQSIPYPVICTEYRLYCLCFLCWVVFGNGLPGCPGQCSVYVYTVG